MQGGDQRPFTGVVEIRIRLVENQQPGFSVECTRQRNTLPQARRQRGSRLANRAVIALWQPQDGLVHTGELCGCHDLLRTDGTEAGNIAAHRTVEQLDILG